VRKTVRPLRCVLFMSAEEDDHASLRQILEPAGWELQGAFTARTGMDALRDLSHHFPVVICNSILPDGDWERILAATDRMPLRPSLVVSSRMADERLWAEVLNLRAFDLLLGGPFDREEVLRVVENAWWASDRYDKYASPPNRRDPERAQGTNSRKLVAGSGS